MFSVLNNSKIVSKRTTAASHFVARATQIQALRQVTHCYCSALLTCSQPYLTHTHSWTHIQTHTQAHTPTTRLPSVCERQARNPNSALSTVLFPLSTFKGLGL